MEGGPADLLGLHPAPPLPLPGAGESVCSREITSQVHGSFLQCSCSKPLLKFCLQGAEVGDVGSEKIYKSSLVWKSSRLSWCCY